MWNKLVLASAVVAGLVAFGPLAVPACRQTSKKTTQTYISPPVYPGYNASSVTPFGMGFNGGGALYAPAIVPVVIPTIPLNNQDVNVYSSSFGYFGVPNGLSLFSYYAYTSGYAMGYGGNYIPPAYAFGGYNPSSVTPFK